MLNVMQIVKTAVQFQYFYLFAVHCIFTGQRRIYINFAVSITHWQMIFTCLQYYSDANDAESWMTEKMYVVSSEDYGRDEQSAMVGLHNITLCKDQIINSLKRRVIIIIIKSHRASRRIRPPRCLTTLLSRATALATSQLFHPALFRSFLTVLLQVVFGLPLAL